MIHDRERRPGPGSPTRGASSGSGGSSEDVPGKRTLTEGLPHTGAVQPKPAPTTPDRGAPTGGAAAQQQVDKPVGGDNQPGFIEWITLLQSGEGMDLAIQMVP